MGFAFNEVVVSLADKPEGLIQMKRFAKVLSISTMSILAVIAFTPLGEFWFSNISGLSSSLVKLDEKEIYKFSNATRAVISPGMKWIAFREYHRSFVTPFEYVGKTLTVSAADKKGYTKRVDSKHDGDFMSWSKDGKTLAWTRVPRQVV